MSKESLAPVEGAIFITLWKLALMYSWFYFACGFQNPGLPPLQTTQPVSPEKPNNSGEKFEG